MPRRLSWLIILTCVALVAACGELSRNPGQDDGGTDAGARTFRITCDLCEAGLNHCVSGECLGDCDPTTPFVTCGSTARCVGAELACIPKKLPTCEEEPCTRDQVCLSTYCVAAGTHACDPLGNDCGTDQVCFGDPPTCATLPWCDFDETCRPGTLGAVCNRMRNSVVLDPRFAEEFCLVGACTSNDHCPAPLTCQEIGAEVEGLGVCR